MIEEFEFSDPKKAAEKKKKEEENEEQITIETQLLEQTLYKLGHLMTIGYGEAGSRIISHNIEKGNELDPMMPGNKIISIFGFCDIRKFTNATEILREGVMIFVNEIGLICHGIVD